ncbi:MAG: YbaN family protein [Alphaproteobacteria bacterium]|nr:YbaN family protein [Alphaproteobacteria bacterium]
MSDRPVARPAFVRSLWKAAGVLSLAIGLIGIVVPLLPTTPFVLLAAYCFQKGSDRLHRWLLEHPRFGPLIHEWRERGAIPPRAKRNAVIALVAVLALSWLLGAGNGILAIQAVVLSAVALFILTRPH